MEIKGPAQAVLQLKKQLEALVAQQLKNLIESRHLYQSVLLAPGALLDQMLQRVGGEFRDHVTYGFQNLIHGLWLARDPYLALRGAGESGSLTNIVFSTPDVKLFCSNCRRIEAFNSVSTEDFLQRLPPEGGYSINRQKIQVFVASFLCQSCKSVPEVFILRRVGDKITICGRAPIETVNVGTAIPKVLRKYYSDAMVAHHSGQSLAGNFLLRTLIEQWARAQVSEPGLVLADEVLDGYMEMLPQDFRSRFPSLRALYSELSNDIHLAHGDAKLFERSRVAIDEHFEARRLYKLAERMTDSTNQPVST